MQVRRYSGKVSQCGSSKMAGVCGKEKEAGKDTGKKDGTE